jgi:DNA excision repair protein ERCC-3
MNPSNPMIVQGDKTVLLEVNSDRYAEARDILARFAELEKSPEYIHTYRITPLSLWNAASSGLQTDEILAGLSEYVKYPVPGNVVHDIQDYMGRYGCVKLVKEDDELHLVSDDAFLIRELLAHRVFSKYILHQVNSTRLVVHPVMRGHIKQALVQIGYPAEDLAGYVDGDSLAFELRSQTLGGERFVPRGYQQEAAEIFYAAGSSRGGSGTIVLPCGAGKTIVGMAAMHQLQTSTLILSPNTIAVRQWIHELLDKTTLTEEEIGEYSGLTKEIRPVTVSTYQILTYRKRDKEDESAAGYEHFALFSARNWGLIIYDEVHLLPAPVFRITAEIQARRRLGLTATLVREDRMEGDVFSLIGPKKYDVPWKDLERQGWIATARCHEVRIRLAEECRTDYAIAPQRTKYRVAAENPAKLTVLQKLVKKHEHDQLLVIGMYLEQLETIAQLLDAPLLTGKTSVREREQLYEQFRVGEIRLLVVSKVANFSIDLPDANVAIEISGSFGSRQEEAQRLGRILRPKHDGSMAYFYTLVTRDTVDQTFAANRQRFLTEQGYEYQILYEDQV